MNINDLFNRQNATAGIKMIQEAATPVGEQSDSGTYYAVQFVTDCTPQTFLAANSSFVTGVQFPAGTVIYADITSIICLENNAYCLYKC